MTKKYGGEEKNYEKFVRGWCITTKSRAAHDFNWWSSWWRVSMWCKFWKYGTAVRNWFSCGQPDRVVSTRATERVCGGGDYGVCRRFQKRTKNESTAFARMPRPAPHPPALRPEALFARKIRDHIISHPPTVPLPCTRTSPADIILYYNMWATVWGVTFIWALTPPLLRGEVRRYHCRWLYRQRLFYH